MCHWWGGGQRAFPKGRCSPQMMALLRRQECFPRIAFLLFIQLLQQILVSCHEGPEGRGGGGVGEAAMKSGKQRGCHSDLKCLLQANIKWSNICKQKELSNLWVCYFKSRLTISFFIPLPFMFQTDNNSNLIHISYSDCSALSEHFHDEVSRSAGRPAPDQASNFFLQILTSASSNLYFLCNWPVVLVMAVLLDSVLPCNVKSHRRLTKKKKMGAQCYFFCSIVCNSKILST